MLFRSNDFTGNALPQGSLSFSPLETQKTITVQVAGDLVIEQDETFSLSLLNPVGATLKTGGPAASISKTASGGYGVTDYNYVVSSGGGIFLLSYNMAAIPDQAEIYVNNNLAASTNGFVSGTGSISVSGSQLKDNDVIRVRITGNDSATFWTYSVNYTGLVS